MLDLSKVEAGVMSVNMIRNDIIPYIRYIVELFTSVAESKKIRLVYNPVPDKFIMDYDPDKLIDIIANLISNALKYSNVGGEVELRSIVTDDGQKFRIVVIDNGPGISEENLQYIFDRFFRIESLTNLASSGSGLGLTLTQELAKLLGGNITVESVVGKGTEFTVTLPVTNGAPLEEPKLVEKVKLPVYSALYDKNIRASETKSNDNPILLIVEDSHDVISYLVELLEPYYSIRSALNGREGWEIALESIPDIILTDIMMPEMDGIELLDRIKNDFRTSHIPVVMLTAKADVASRLEGLRRGADVYISKPFNSEELIVQINRLIETRSKLHERYSISNQFPGHGDEEFNMEDSFMIKIRNIMMENINNEDFNIQTLCRILSVSRTQLYRKFNSLTNQTINKYLRSLRLCRAKELLLSRRFNVSETAYRTGFKNISHFSKVFKDEFGINPGEINK
jgi:CheY-like chemotaxis protein/AraC-like DNA-binding protein/two-component sensor histidine kinase